MVVLGTYTMCYVLVYIVLNNEESEVLVKLFSVELVLVSK